MGNIELEFHLSMIDENKYGGKNQNNINTIKMLKYQTLSIFLEPSD
jgi:hypothetical protein